MRSKNYQRILAAVLAAGMTIGCAGCSSTGSSSVSSGNTGGSEVKNTEKAELVVSPVLPERAQYPTDAEWDAYYNGESSEEDESLISGETQDPETKYDIWSADRQSRLEQVGDSDEGLMAYWKKSMAVFLQGEDGKNRVYSPLNTYLALSMLAEVTDGESRQQILDALEASDVETVRSRAKELWDANYVDDGTVKSLLGASLWLSQDMNYEDSTVNTLAEDYYSSVFRGEMGSEDYDKLLQDWTNDQTGGLLSEAVQGLTFDPQTVMALVTTIYYKAAWEDEYSEDNNTEETFHGADSQDTQCTFMHRSAEGMFYYGEHFSAIRKSMTNSGCMWLILPDEGTTPEELAGDEELMELLAGSGSEDGEYSKSKDVVIHESVPKFDVSSTMSLNDGMKALGISDVFSGEKADFSALLGEDSEGTVLSTATHSARVKIDEDGVEAAAYTAMMMAGAAMPPDDEVDFVLDRPFLFVITGDTGAPLFAGVVNQIGE